MKTTEAPEWCKELSKYAFDYRKDGELAYKRLIDLIRTADGGGTFDISSTARCRLYLHNMAVVQVKDVPWDYLYVCMKTSGKDFQIKLPDGIAEAFLSHIRPDKGEQPVYAWHDPETDGVKVLAYTGRFEEEENTAPAYDGYGRFDTYYEVVEGTLNPEGTMWTEAPSRHFVSS